jgi:hypothetical protein
MAAGAGARDDLAFRENAIDDTVQQYQWEVELRRLEGIALLDLNRLSESQSALLEDTADLK